MTKEQVDSDLRKALCEYTEFHERGMPGMPFFQSIERQHELLDELERWRGTPFNRSGLVPAKRGHTSNCVTFVEAVLRSCGATLPIAFPPYVVSGGGAPMLEAMLSGLQASGLRPVSEVSDNLSKMVGDVILVSTGKKLHHLAIYAGDNTIWHSLEKGRGVCTGNLFDPLIQRYAHSLWRAFDHA